MIHAAWKDTLKYLHLAAIIMLSFVVAALYLTGNTNNVVSPENLVIFKQHETLTINSTNPSCNFFSGRWVYDDVYYPLYKEGKCDLIGEEFSCEENGRNNLKYQNWRWQPHHCDLPRFNGTTLLEKLRNKKLVFVGDSLCRNQWRSLLCLTEPYFPPSTNKTVYIEGNFMNLHVKDYNTTIAFYWAPYLVESNCDNLLKHNSRKRMVRIKSIEKHGRHWINADVLIFDSFAWWSPDMTIMWSPFDRPDAINKKVNTSSRLYEIAVDTWSDWLEFHIDRNKTKLFFTSVSPYRRGATPWGTSGACFNSTEPIFDDTCWREVPIFVMKIVESTIEKLEERGVKVEYLNITQLSSYREDAHPSIYMTHWKNVDPKLRNPNKLADCMHWCLPGVPDVWNEILYAYIIKP